jgi:hypothetical protein
MSPKKDGCLSGVHFQMEPLSSQLMYESVASTKSIQMTMSHNKRVALREGASFARLKMSLSKFPSHPSPDASIAVRRHKRINSLTG